METSYGKYILKKWIDDVDDVDNVDDVDDVDNVDDVDDVDVVDVDGGKRMEKVDAMDRTGWTYMDGCTVGYMVGWGIRVSCWTSMIANIAAKQKTRLKGSSPPYLNYLLHTFTNTLHAHFQLMHNSGDRARISKPHRCHS